VGSVVAKWVHLDKPTVAAVNGIALGGGANLALYCDMLLMREDAAIGQSYVQRGLSVDMGKPAFAEKREPRFTGR
jgi:enoyl-CoA hydratase/carnithine racemase